MGGGGGGLVIWICLPRCGSGCPAVAGRTAVAGSSCADDVIDGTAVVVVVDVDVVVVVVDVVVVATVTSVVVVAGGSVGVVCATAGALDRSRQASTAAGNPNFAGTRADVSEPRV